MSRYMRAQQMIAKADSPKELAKDIVAAPIEAHRIWMIHRPETVAFDKDRVGQMAAAFVAGRNPFAGMFDARLSGVGHHVVWDKHPFAAICQCDSKAYNLAVTQFRYVQPSDYAAKHEAPARDCSCGIWALKDEASVTEALAEYVRGGGAFAYGRVHLWGRVFEHKIGYRAQHAKPVEITVINGDEATVKELAAFYGCEVKAGEAPAALQAAIAKRRAAYAQSPMAWSSTYAALLSQQKASMASMSNHLSAHMNVVQNMTFGPTLSGTRRRGSWPMMLAFLALAVLNGSIIIARLVTHSFAPLNLFSVGALIAVLVAAWINRPREEVTYA